MIEAAIENDVDPIRISFVHAVRTVLMFAPVLAREPIWKLPQNLHGNACGNRNKSCSRKTGQKRTAICYKRKQTLPKIERYTRTMEKSLCRLRKRHSGQSPIFSYPDFQLLAYIKYFSNFILCTSILSFSIFPDF